MKKVITLLACIGICVSCVAERQSVDTDKALSYCASQVERTLESLAPIDYTMMPRNIAPDSSKWHLRKATKEEWCGGFWPGVLWYVYEATGSERFRTEAEKFTASLEELAYTPAYDHDLGFLVFLSYGNGYRLTQNPRYKEIMLATADTLATLYNPHVGTILSWPREVSHFGNHNTIMDNLINLEMLFWAARNGGSKKLYDIAVNHADKTMENCFRSDYTSYHLVVYDSISGNKLYACTHQGYSDSSMWARGQAWGIYGYTVCYRETRDPRYLDFAEKITDVYLAGLPEDGVPYWDFNAPDIPHAPRDASAACVTASALLELSTLMPAEKGAKYRAAAEKMLASLSSPAYQSGAKNPAMLMHSTGHYPNGSEVDYSIIYADYYYIEALLRLQRLQRGLAVMYNI